MTQDNKGFTLIEILVGLAVTGIVMTTVYTAYMSQQRSYVAQEAVAIMQQNLRAGMYMMTRELRMAGYDPKRTANAKIESLTTTTGAATVRFTKDEDMSGSTAGDSGEDVTYNLYVATDGIQKLGRKNPTNNMPVAENIEKLHLTFLTAAGVPTTDTTQVRSVQITLVAKSERKDNDYHNSFSYKDLQGGTYNIGADGFRRAALSTQISCRNLGL